MSLKLIKNWNKKKTNKRKVQSTSDKVTQCFKFRKFMAIERSYLKMVNPILNRKDWEEIKRSN